MILYLDTSALVKLWTQEPGAQEVEDATRSASVVSTSVVSYAETRSAFARALREGRWTTTTHETAVGDLDHLWPQLMRIRVSNGLSFEAGALAQRHRLRGFDAIHLASALRTRAHLDVDRVTFACFDERLAQGAREIGMEVVGFQGPGG